MEKQDILNSFIEKRPNTLGAFGYGSGVFKQASYSEKAKPQLDLMFVVDDVGKWHQENLGANPHDYPILGKIHINRGNLKDLKGPNKITYFSNIKEDDYVFKYGVIELEDWHRSLETWDNFFVAGRFQKPLLPIKINEDIKKLVLQNRLSATMVAAIFSNELTTSFDFFKSLCNLSYMGTLRMAIAENPEKVANIVNGGMEEFIKMYVLNQDYITFVNPRVIIINHEKLLARIKELPTGLYNYLVTNNYDLQNINSLRRGISKYLKAKNRNEEIYQALHELENNGLARSIPYMKDKLVKKLVRKS